MDAVDTSVLYALFNEADDWHDKAKRTLRERRPILVPPGVLQETLELLHLRHGAAHARSALQWLAQQPMVLLDPAGAAQSHQAAAEAFLSGTRTPEAHRIGFADVWCVAHALERGAGLVTNDARQAKFFKTWAAQKS